jgi:hypothetical protein
LFMIEKFGSYKCRLTTCIDLLRSLFVFEIDDE